MDNLPKDHYSDLQVYRFVYKYKSNQWIDADIPIPQSREAVEALASCQKKKHPKLYEEQGEKMIKVYKLRDEVTTAFRPDEHSNPLPAIPIFESELETYSGRTVAHTNLPVTTQRKDRNFD